MRVNAQCLPEGSDRLLHLGLVQQGVAQVDISRGIIRLDSQSLPAMVRRHFVVALQMQGIAQAGMGLRKIRLEPQCFLVVGHRFLEVANGLVYQPEVGVELRYSRLQLQHMANRFNGLVELTHLGSKHTQQVMGVGIVRLPLQDLPV